MAGTQGQTGRYGVPGRGAGEGRPTVCLCMIVRNEARVIERCLAAARPLIDSWVIDDTGSTDGTRELVRRALDGIPGELHEVGWRDFGYNRTVNIRRARGRADYLLLLDADMVVRVEGDGGAVASGSGGAGGSGRAGSGGSGAGGSGGGGSVGAFGGAGVSDGSGSGGSGGGGLAGLPPLTADAYMLRHVGDLEYRIKRLVRAGLPWRYEGVTHEYLTADRPHTTADLDALVIDHRADGGSRADKFTRDAALLSADLERDPDNPRTVFYLAQTRRDLGETDEAIDLYERRAAMGGWPEEVYYALLQSGVLRAERGAWPLAMDRLVRAWQTRPQRLEACYELVSRLRRTGQYEAAHAFASAAVGREAPGDWLFVQPWVYRWGMLFEFSITAYWTGDAAASLAACDRLLGVADLPEAYREQTVRNREFAVKAVGAGASVPAPAVPTPAG